MKVTHIIKVTFIIIVCLLFYRSANAQWLFNSAPAELETGTFFSNVKYFSKAHLLATYDSPNQRIYESYDGGLSFQSWPITLGAIQSVLFVDESTLLAVDYYAKLYKSIDKGKSFKQFYLLNQSGDTILNKLKFNANILFFFYDSLNGWVINQDTSAGCLDIWTTRNGAVSWSKIPCAQINLTAISVRSSMKVQALGDQAIFYSNGKFIKASKFGDLWTETKGLPLKGQGSPNLWAFKDSLIGIQITANKDSNLFKTNDGGKTWNYISGVTSFLTTIDYAAGIGKNVGFYIAGSSSFNGDSFISKDEGLSWEKVDELSHNHIQFYNSISGISVKRKSEPSTDDIRILIQHFYTLE